MSIAARTLFQFAVRARFPSSSNLRAASYYPSAAKLTVTFHSGSTYEYQHVPLDVFVRLSKAESPGGFFARHIRHRFAYAKLP